MHFGNIQYGIEITFFFLMALKFGYFRIKNLLNLLLTENRFFY